MVEGTRERLERLDWRIDCTERACQMLDLSDVMDTLWEHLGLISDAAEHLPDCRGRVIRTTGRDRNEREYWMLSGFRHRTTLVLLPDEIL